MLNMLNYLMKNKYGKEILDNSLSAGKDFAKIAVKKVLTKCRSNW